MRRALVLGCLLLSPSTLMAGWIRYASGPFELLTDAGERPGQEMMLRFEEFRHALGQVVGEQDLKTPEPIRIVLFKNSKGWTSPAPITMGRDRYAIVLSDNSPVPPAVYSELTRLLLDANTTRMPVVFEQGLMKFFSTFAVSGIHITVGAPPANPDLNWARIHYLVVAPENYGRVRTLLYNLRKGVEEDPAYRNAFGKSADQIEALVKKYFAAGNFQTTSISSRPLAAKDFEDRQISDADMRLARADLLAGAQSAAEYQSLLKEKLKVPEAEEGLGWLALRDKQNDQARAHFAAAIEEGSNSARCFIEYARLEPDRAKAEQALLKAAGINPKLDEPFALMAARDTDPARRLMHWKAAAERDPRNATYWKELAEGYLADHNYVDAAKAWRQGEQAAVDPAQRQKMHQALLSVEEQRFEYEAAEKRRIAEEDARELEALKNKARAELHAAEDKYNKGAKPVEGAVPWWDGPKPGGKVSGNLKQVDCLGKQARLVVETADRKTVKLLVVDSEKIVTSGSNSAELGCGVQKARHVTIEYFPKVNARLATAGEVATIEFQ